MNFHSEPHIMIEFILKHYLVFKAVHIIAVICWMAGLLYLPRLFVYHANATPVGEADKTFKVMEYKLYNYIMNPSMFASYALGSMLFISNGNYLFWMHPKIILVFLLTFCHLMMGKYMMDFAINQNKKSATYFRVFNEIPSILMVFIVIIAVTKPFS
jgi:putative membrane protein